MTRSVKYSHLITVGRKIIVKIIEVSSDEKRAGIGFIQAF